MGKGGGGSSQRPVTAEERRLWDAQADQLDVLAKVTEDQYNLSKEDRDYYEKVFRDGTDTEAKEAVAKLKSTITGEAVDPASIQDVNVDTLLRDTLLNASPEFKEAATNYIDSASQLTDKYGTEVTGLSSAFSQNIKDLTTNYSNELQTIKQETGTIDQDILARETGAATAGISTAFAESRKQMASEMARRGLSGSGVEMSALGSNYQQEAMTKAQAGVQARSSALQQSEAVRQQQMGIAGMQLQAGMSGSQTAYQTDIGAVQNVYGVTSAQALQNYNLDQAATMQGVAGLTQLAQAGQGIYQGSANYLQGASQSSAQGAQIAGSSASSLANVNNQYTMAKMQQSTAERGQTLEMVGTLAGAGIGKMPISDATLKTNINYVGSENGHNIYTWDWIEGIDGGYNKGVLAQEVMRYIPEAVYMDDNENYRVDYDKLGLSHLVEEIA